MGLRRGSRGTPDGPQPTPERLRKKWPWAASLNPEGRGFPGYGTDEYRRAIAPMWPTQPGILAKWADSGRDGEVSFILPCLCFIGALKHTGLH